MFGFFRKKKEINEIRENIQSSFNSVKDDFKKVGDWINHLDGKHKLHDGDISMIKKQVEEMQKDLEEIKGFVSFFEPQLSKQLSKHHQTGVNKQTNVEGVQTPVQTAVQTGILSNLTVMERALIWTLLNTEMKMSYEDLAALMGKDKSTIRGQINVIKQKSDGLIEESTELNGKKRIFIPEKIKGILMKNVKVRVNSIKKDKKEQKSEEIV